MILPAEQVAFIAPYHEADRALTVDEIPDTVAMLRAEEALLNNRFWQWYGIMHAHNAESLRLMHERNALRVRVRRLQTRLAKLKREQT